jgi:non-ribosomal peptide synthetase component F
LLQVDAEHCGVCSGRPDPASATSFLVPSRTLEGELRSLGAAVLWGEQTLGAGQVQTWRGFRTGDIGVINRRDGLSVLGRFDDQVKILGKAALGCLL